MKERKVKEAAALIYTKEDSAPKIVALGKGEIAEKIIGKAKESNVPVHENAELAHTLNTLSIGDEIPPELYQIVAEILVFIGDIDRKKGEKKYGIQEEARR